MKSSVMILAAFCTVFLTACSEQNTAEISEQVSLSAETQTEEASEEKSTEHIAELNTMGEEIPEIKPAYKRTNTVYYADDKKTVEYIYLYDEHDNRLGTVFTDSDNIIQYNYVYEYNNKGLVTSEYNFGSDINFSKTSIEYNPDDTIKSRTYFSKYGSDSTSTTTTYYFYDDCGKLIRTEYTDFNNVTTVSEKYSYEYDEHGNATVIKVYNGSDELKYTKYQQFDENGNVTESKTVHADDSWVPVFLICYEYDESGNIISKECLNIDQTDTVTKSELETYVYSNDKIISTEHYIDGELSTHTDYTYEYYE